MSAAQYKLVTNQAGGTVFVHPTLMVGTLSQGFGCYLELVPELWRAIFTMFLVTAVHPPIGGNRRIARIMTNAELVSAGLDRIIIPTRYRDEYVGHSGSCQSAMILYL